jgi:hypothetical protein
MQPTEFSLDFLQPLALGSFRNWLTVRNLYKGVERPYRKRAFFTGLFSLITTPLRVYERARYARRVEETEIEKAPIFIVGHWRGGTTHLHNLLCQDQRFGYVTTLQTIAPDAFLTADQTLGPLLARILPPTRMMDNMAWTLHSPQEEEFALANLCPYSFYHHWSFPKYARQCFEQYALFKDVPVDVIQVWKHNYLSILKKATFNMHGKQLVLKNPTNTGRIPALLEMFPEAKFIHIYRSPYKILPSTRRLYTKTLPVTQMQGISSAEMEANILYFYSQILQKFFTDKHLIPSQNLVEVKFERLEATPLREMRRIYQNLSISDFDSVKPALKDYLQEKADYQKNQYTYTRETIEKVKRYWSFALRKWGYAPPSD